MPSSVSCSTTPRARPGRQTGTALQSSATGIEPQQPALRRSHSRTRPNRRTALGDRSDKPQCQHDIQVLTPKRRSHCIVGAANRSQVDPESFPPHGRLSRARAGLVLPSIDRMRLTRAIDECRVRTTCWVHVSDLNPALQRTQRRAPPRPRRRNRGQPYQPDREACVSRHARLRPRRRSAPRSVCDTAVAPARSVDDSRRPSSCSPSLPNERITPGRAQITPARRSITPVRRRRHPCFDRTHG